MPPIHPNLTVAMLDHQRFGDGRFTDRPKHHAIMTAAQATVVRLHAADRLQVVPPAPQAQCTCPAWCTYRPKAWPYDTPLPSGLSSLPIQPDNARSPPVTRLHQNLPPLPTDELGNTIDVSF